MDKKLQDKLHIPYDPKKSRYYNPLDDVVSRVYPDFGSPIRKVPVSEEIKELQDKKNKKLRTEFYPGKISDQRESAIAKHRALDMTAGSINKALKRGSLGMEVDRNLNRYGLLGVYYPSRGHITINHPENDETSIHELAHALWSRKSKNEKAKFLDSLHKELRRKNLSKESIEDISQAIQNYERNVSRFYKGGTEERSNEWHSQIASVMPFVSLEKSYVNPPSANFVWEAGDQNWNKYPEIRENYRDFLSEDFLRRADRIQGKRERISAPTRNNVY